MKDGCVSHPFNGHLLANLLEIFLNTQGEIAK
jgi:hypothetical protein